MTTDDQEFYQKIGELLWSVMPVESEELILKGQLYIEHQEFQLISKTKGETLYLSIPTDVLLNSRDLMKKLQKCEIYAKEPWTQFKITLSNEGKFRINFAYIPEEDSWPRIFMKGISDFTEKEWQKTSILKELWEERVRQKNR